jgi:hypothetical protein
MRGRSALLITGLAIAGAIGTSTSASAQPLEHGRFHDVFTETFDCDGTPTQLDVDAWVNFNVVKRGPGLVYFGNSVRGTEVYTNLNTAGTFTQIFTANFRDLHVTDNGDGTLTIVVQGAGSSRWYDTDGNFVLADPGQIRFQFMVDHMGTPDDPFDDEEIDGSFQIIRESTGRNDTQGRDFCADLVEFTD